MNQKYFQIFFIGLVLLTSGCLQTRTSVKESEQRQVIQQQVSTIQRSSADTSSRFADLEEQIRNLNGRIEVAENQAQKMDQQSSTQHRGMTEQVNESNKKNTLLQDSMIKMEQQIAALQAEVGALRAEQAAGQARSTVAASNQKQQSKNSFETANDFFNDKDWKKAIVSFQKYRDENPKGKNFLEATFRTGVCFQELGLKDEAKTFYEEVVAKFPKSEEAKKAKLRIKRLK